MKCIFFPPLPKLLFTSFFPSPTLFFSLFSLVCRDKAIPSLDSISSPSDQDSYEESRLSMFLENQIQEEKKVANKILEDFDENYLNLRTESTPPPVSHEFQTSRLLLSHLGFISVQVSKKEIRSSYYRNPYKLLVTFLYSLLSHWNSCKKHEIDFLSSPKNFKLYSQSQMLNKEKGESGEKKSRNRKQLMRWKKRLRQKTARKTHKMERREK